MTYILIIGYGYVGKAVANFFKDHYNILIYDPHLLDLYKKSNESVQLPESARFVNYENEKKVVFDAYNGNFYYHSTDIILTFICVPTEQKSTGECNTSIVEETVKWLPNGIDIIIKSTVPPGTTDEMSRKYKKNIVFSPEFIGEGKYDKGQFNFDKNIGTIGYFIFGGKPELTKNVINIYQRIGGPSKRYIQTDSKTAETSKYITNSWLATKLTFFYEIDQICKVNETDYNKVRELIIMDPRLTNSHTCVFSNQEKPFDGKCLPKDTSAIVNHSRENGHTLELLKEVLDSCNRISQIRKFN